MNWYYALLDENNICISVDNYGEEVLYPNYIRVDTLDDSIVGMLWNGSAFVEAPIHLIAAHSTDSINVGTQDVWLTTKLNNTDAEIADKADKASVYTTDNLVSFDSNGNMKDSGKSVDNFALVGHAHTGLYAVADHVHNDYSPVTHTHTGTYSPNNHTHDDSYSAINHTHAEYSGVNHTHTNYAAASHTHDGYATSTHTHTGYAASNHTHTTIANNLDITGIVRVKGQQAISMDTTALSTVLGTGNHDTYIAGKSVVQINATTTKCSHLMPRNNASHDLGGTNRFRNIYLTNTPNISSDERLKENITPVDSEKCLNFVVGINPVTYNYKGDEEERFGVIAQNLLAADPELSKYIVATAPDEYLSVKPSDLTYALIGAVKQLKAEVDALKAK